MLEQFASEISLFTATLGLKFRALNFPISDAMWLMIFLVHTLISALLAFACWCLLVEKFRQPRWTILSLLFSFGFFIPIVGWLGLYLSVMLGLYWQRKTRNHPFATMLLPEFDLISRDFETTFDSGGIKACLVNTATPLRRRLQALLTMQSVNARTSNPALQNLLNDKVEDIRLVAYGLIDGREKRINQLIYGESLRLQTVQTPALKLISLRHLAELEWEVVYTKLAQGDLRKRALTQALSYIDQALEIDDSLAGLWFLKGRALLECHLYTAAEVAFDRSKDLGLILARLYPYYAELAYVQRRFQTARAFLSLMKSEQVPAHLESIMHYWTTQNELINVDLSGHIA